MVDRKCELRDLVEPVCEHLVPVLRDSLEICVERHRVAIDKGADGYSFGTDAWSFPKSQLLDHFETGSRPFTIFSQRPFVLAYGNFRLRHHRVGRDQKDDIWQSFPNQAKSAVHEASQQKSFEFAEGSLEPKAIVLAYMANEEDGLCAVYLTRVGRVRKDKVVKWSDALLVWRKEDSTLTSAFDSDLVPPEKIEIPAVKRIRGVEKDEKILAPERSEAPEVTRMTVIEKDWKKHAIE